ncbi:hypothetical protein Patl1_14013 [Pistacia atlantica]|uniref:Uncharacterized protein n=1 Tax=Pistacia atlantica TaxID=434234 RepID=A0ACC1ATR8_9ROSI|nr:hypothetical protein Patl1_14013 [Pistacia atlantica]
MTIKNFVILDNEKVIIGLVVATLALTVVEVGPASAAELPLLASSLQLNEPSNALSLPTWAVHVSVLLNESRITAMALVWQYGEKSGYEAWKGLSWGMVPLLGGAFRICAWHFFYNSKSLECLKPGFEQIRSPWVRNGPQAWLTNSSFVLNKLLPSQSIVYLLAGLEISNLYVLTLHLSIGGSSSCTYSDRHTHNEEKGNGMLEMSLIDDKADFRGAKISKLEIDMVP